MVPTRDRALQVLAVVLFEFIAPLFSLSLASNGIFGRQRRFLEIWFEVGAATFVALQGSLQNRFCDWEHVLQGFSEDHVLIGPTARIRQADFHRPFMQVL